MHIGWNTFSVISDPQHNFVLEQSQRNIRSRALGMAMNIRQTFLQNAKQCQFERFRQAPEVFRDVQAGRNAAAFREAFHIPACGGFETGFVQQAADAADERWCGFRSWPDPADFRDSVTKALAGMELASMVRFIFTPTRY